MSKKCCKSDPPCKDCPKRKKGKKQRKGGEISVDRNAAVICFMRLR